MAGTNALRIALGAGAGIAIVAAAVLVEPLLRPRDTALPAGQAEDTVPEATEPAQDPAGLASVDAAEPEPEGVVGADPEAELAAPPEPAAQPESAAPPPPVIDVVRIDPDGTGLIAGKAPAGMAVAVLLGQVTLAEAVADATGSFVAFVTLPPSDTPRILSLLADPGGAAVPSDATVIVAPNPVVASQPEPQPEPQPEIVAAIGAPPLVPQAEAALPEVAQASVAPAADEAVSPEPEVAAPDAAPQIATAENAEAAVAELAQTPVATPEPLPEPSPELGPDLGPELVSEPGQVPTSVPDLDVEAAPQTETAALPDADLPPPEPPIVIAVTQTPPPIAAPSSEPAQTGALAPTTLPAADSVLVAPADPAPQGQSATLAIVAPEPPARVPHIPPEVEDSVAALQQPAPDVPGIAPVLRMDEEGVRVLQPAIAPGASPEVLATVALDAIAYDDAGEVILSGRAAGGGTVRVYVDNRPVIAVPVGANGQWTSGLPDVPTGVYTMRVDQLDAAGTVISRIETPFLREDRATIAAAMVEQTNAPEFTVAVKTVQPGATLWAIARDRYGDGVMYVLVFEANRDRIRNPDLIYPGQVFVLPEVVAQ